MDLGNLLGAFGASNKETVYLSVTPDVGLELIKLDTNARIVKSYSCRPLEYNETARDIADYEQFKNAVRELLREANINPKCNIVLNLPTVLFGYKDVAIIVGSDGLSTIITSEVEQSYIFKRSDPVVGWVEYSDTSMQEARRVFYTAIQQEVVDNIRTALGEIGATLLSIEVSLVSKLRALDFTGFASEQMSKEEPWNLLIINRLGYSICSMKGRNLIEYYEEAIPVKSFDGEEIYKAISASAQLTLMSYPSKYLYIISDTDDVSAEILANKLPVDGTIQFIENNKYKKREFLETSLDVIQDNVLKISLDAIGNALNRTVNTNLSFNILDRSSDDTDPNSPIRLMIGNKEYLITPATANFIAFVLVAIILSVFGAFYFMVTNYTKTLDNKLQDVQSKVQAVENEISQIESKTSSAMGFDAKTEIKRVLDSNRTKLIAYSALGESVPKNLWITYFVTADNGGLDIKGKASSVEDIYVFFTNLKDSMINSDLRLQKLEMEPVNLEDLVEATNKYPNYYIFEITNMSAPINTEESASEKNENSSIQTSDRVNQKQPQENLNQNKNRNKNPLFGGKNPNMEPIPEDELE